MTTDLPHMGTLHTSKVHGQVFLVRACSAEEHWVHVSNITLGRDFFIPLAIFIRHFQPLTQESTCK
jgi:ribosomal protein S12 methylthiotransferase accessory factor YcaO